MSDDTEPTQSAAEQLANFMADLNLNNNPREPAAWARQFSALLRQFSDGLAEQGFTPYERLELLKVVVTRMVSQ